MFKLALILCLALCPGLPAFAGQQGEDAFRLEDYRPGSHFQGLEAALVIEDIGTGARLVFHPEDCRTRYSPCSTFKIFNSMVGLETGVLKSENTTLDWDGTRYSIESWNRDQTLQSAVTNSCVWYFQRVATRVGRKRMRNYIEKAGYGNQDLSGGVRTFWLDSTLKISPFEQVSLIKRLIADELPFSKRTTGIVRGILRQEETARGTLYGKTGSAMRKGKKVMGWYVGYVIQPGKSYAFATNIRATDGAWGPRAREITVAILKDMKLL